MQVVSCTQPTDRSWGWLSTISNSRKASLGDRVYMYQNLHTWTEMDYCNCKSIKIFMHLYLRQGYALLCFSDQFWASFWHITMLTRGSRVSIWKYCNSCLWNKAESILLAYKDAPNSCFSLIYLISICLLSKNAAKMHYSVSLTFVVIMKILLFVNSICAHPLHTFHNLTEKAIGHEVIHFYRLLDCHW